MLEGHDERRYRRFFRLRPWSATNVDREVDDEIGAHLQMRTEELMRRGLSPDEAREEARRRFGDLEEGRRRLRRFVRERERRATIREWFSSVWQDARYGARQMVQAPGFAVVAVATFAIGIGATTTIFTVVDRVLLRPLPYHDPERLVALGSVDSGGAEFYRTSSGNWRDWADRNRTFAGIALASSPTALAVSGGDDAFLASVSRVSPEFFDVMRPPVEAGRLPAADEAGPAGIAVVSERLWQRALDSDADLSRDLRVGERRLRVIGVVSEGAEYPAGTDVWLPTEIRALTGGYRNHVNWLAVGRLQAGSGIDRARDDLGRVAAGIRAEEPTTLYSYGVAVQPLRKTLVGESSRHMVLLLASVSFVLLMACVNIASANLARSAARGNEMALRTALGAERGRLVRQLLVEHLLPALAGGAIGAAIAVAMVRVIVSQAAEDIPRASEIAVDGRVLLVAFVAAMLAGLMSGLAPALHATRRSLRDALSSGGRSAVGGGRRLPAAALVGAEISLAVVLLAGAGLLIRSFQEVIGRGLGFDAEGLVLAEIVLPRSRYADDDATVRYWESVFRELRASPAVESAGAANWVPLGRGGTGFFEVAGREAEKLPGIGYRVVTDDYLQALGVPLLAGRGFSPSDVRGSERVALVNRASMQKHFGGISPIGQRVRTAGMEGTPGDEPPPWITIIGVVGDVRHFSLESDPLPEIYVLHRQVPAWARSFTLVVRGSTTPTRLSASVRRQIGEVDPQIVTSVEPFATRVDRSLSERRLIMSLLTAFGAIAGVIAAIGVYGVVSFGVTQRTREMAVRCALGANRGNILLLVLGSAGKVIAAGIIAGLVLSAVLTRLLESMLVDVRHDDPVTLGTAALALLGIGLGAAVLPAVRATRVDPMVAMRAE